LFGPFLHNTEEKYVLVGSGGENKWLEALVLNEVSSDNLQHYLQQMIERQVLLKKNGCPFVGI